MMFKKNAESKKATILVVLLQGLWLQTVDKGHECHKMFVAFSMRIFKEIVEISTLKMIFMV